MKQMKVSSVKLRKEPSRKVFRHLVNEAAFIDKIVVSVNGKLTEHFVENALIDDKSQAIYREGNFYSRCIFAKSLTTRNPLKIYHGRSVGFKNVPLLRFSVKSERSPVTAAETLLLIKTCVKQKAQIRIAEVELTFDISEPNFDWIVGHLFHRKFTTTLLEDECHWRTIYVGSPKSSWQIRIYEKAAFVTRIEFILRRAFLSKYGIEQPEDVVKLKNINVWRFLSLRRFSKTKMRWVMRNWTNHYSRKLFLNWFKEGRALNSLLIMLRVRKINPDWVSNRTRFQKKLERMLQQLVW